MLFVPGVAVGAKGMPLRFGDAKDAFKAKLVATSDVFAFKLSAVFTSVAFALSPIIDEKVPEETFVSNDV